VIVKNNFLFLSLFCVIYLFLSLSLYKNVAKDNPHRDIDSPGYERQALVWAQSSLFAWNLVGSNLQSPHKSKPPLVQQPVGYPLFIGMIYKLFGTQDIFLIWIQILLTLLSGLLLFFATAHLFAPTVARIAFALFCVNVGYITFAQFILAEALLLFFLLLFLERFLYFVKTSRPTALGTAGLALGISTAVKPAALYYIIPLLILFIPFVIARKSLSLRSKLLLPLILCFSFFVPIKGYQLYNYATYGVANVGALGKYNLYVWFWSKVATDQQNPENSARRNKLFSEEQKKRVALIKGNPLKPSSWANLQKEFFDAVAKKPYIFVKTWIREMLKTYLGLYTTNLKVLVESNLKGGDVSFSYTDGSIGNRIYQYITRGTEKPIIQLIGFYEFGWNLIKYLFVLIALLWLLMKRRWFLACFFSSYLFYFALVTGFDGCARYRTMFEFILLLLAALGIHTVLLFTKKLSK